MTENRDSENHGTDSRDTDPLDGLVSDGALVRPVHIIASPYKTGTTSVSKALLELGVGHRAMPHRGQLLRDIRPLLNTWNKRAANARNLDSFAAEHGTALRKDMKDFVKKIAPFDVFHDAPMGHGHLHPFLCKVLAPHAKFIWVDRDFDDWLASVRHWEETHPETYPAHTEWETDPDLRRKRKHNHRKRKWQQFKRIRREEPASTLVLRWSDLSDYKALAAFYDVPAPDAEFPRANVSRSEHGPPA